MTDLDPLFRTNKNLGIYEDATNGGGNPFDKSLVNATGNPDNFSKEVDVQKHDRRADGNVASFLLYLSDVREGGETMFPFENGLSMDVNYDFKRCIGLKVKPRQGDGLLFYSVFPNGTIDPGAKPDNSTGRNPAKPPSFTGEKGAAKPDLMHNQAPELSVFQFWTNTVCFKRLELSCSIFPFFFLFGAFFHILIVGWPLIQTSLHGSCPVIEGEKWVATKWIRDQEQED
ncbi:hypothetical protein HHK36_009813 [Tetracentron sinense]|uniref:Uncharacterized protein n=1 Tax=Tetracentron sinense TaxID=13715 RepID=A0A834ZGS4_TETSI|nr:hypothetical protein HHK36_009813 [Tetracentron sinense]